MNYSRTRTKRYEMWLPVNIPRPKSATLILSKPVRRCQPKPLHITRLIAPQKGAKVKQIRNMIDKNVHSTFNVPGLEKILHSSSYWIKLIWILAFFAFYGLCIYQLMDRISLYIAAPVTVDVTIEKATSVEFPSVTVCPPFGTTIWTYKICRELRKGNKPNIFGRNNFTLETVWEEFKFKEEDITAEGSCIAHEEKNSTKHLEEKDKTCSSRLNMETVEKQPLSTFWGKCLWISPPTKLMYRGAWTYIKLEVTRPEDVSNSSICKDFIRLQDNVVFVPNEKSIIPGHEVMKQFYFVNKGGEVAVDFRRNKFVHLNTTKTPCVKTKYAIDCMHKCLETLLNEKLSCRFPFMTNSSLTPCPSVLNIESKLRYVEKIYREFDGCNCHRPCYEKILIYDADYRAVKTSKSDEAVFILSYTDNSIEVITETYAYPFASLLTDIGGNLGFCVGLSLFSFVEIILSTFQMARIGIGKICMGRRRQPVNLPFSA